MPGFGRTVRLRSFSPISTGRAVYPTCSNSLAREITPPEVVYLLNRLHGFGLLAEGVGSPALGRPDADLTFWQALGVEDDRAPERVKRSPVRVRVVDARGHARFMVDALEAAGVCVVEQRDPALEIVVTDHYFRPELKDINDAALKNESPWMVCKLVGQTLWIGPIFRPGRTGCMTCLQDRLRLNRQVEDFVVPKDRRPDLLHDIAGGAACGDPARLDVGGPGDRPVARRVH